LFFLRPPNQEFPMKNGSAPFGVRPSLVCAGAVLVASLAILATSHAPGGQAKNSQKVEIADLPQPIAGALGRAGEVFSQPLAGAQWTEAMKLAGAEHPIFQIRGKNGRGNKIEVEVTAAGRIIEVEEHGIPQSEVPAAVMKALKDKMPEVRLEKVEAIYQMDPHQPACFGFEGQDGRGKSFEIYISADGKTFLN
jgi:hypothetical protein